jgi:hypothetical protein
MPTSPKMSRRSLFSLIGAPALAPATGQSQESAPARSMMAKPSGSRESSGVLYELAEGPWGALSYYYFYLEAPSHLVDLIPLPNPRTRWAVPVSQEATLRQVITNAPLPPDLRDALLNPNLVGASDGIHAIFPPGDVLERIPAGARAEIYRFLGRFDLNDPIKNPVRIRSGSIDEWAQGTDIRPELVQLIKEMSYLQGDLLLFSDFPHLIGKARSESEAKMLHKHTSRVRSMVVRLDTKRMESARDIMPYWSTGLGLRRKEIEYLIDEAIETPGVDTLDLAHLLPPLPRKLLFTYPDSSMALEGTLPDCHWTSLNFFNYEPQPIYLDEFFAASRLLENFDQIEPPYRFGDVMVFLNEDMNAYHSCIYLAADIVYTKNGRSLYAPFTLLPLDDVASTYTDGDGKPLRLQGFRKRGSVA